MRGLFPVRPIADAPPDPGSQIFNTAGTHHFVVPERVRRIRASLIGRGGRGANGASGNWSGGGGGGGAFARDPIDVVPGQILECINGGSGTPTRIVGYFAVDFGRNGSGTTGGAGGVATPGVEYSVPGGRGGNGSSGSSAKEFGAGGGGAGGENRAGIGGQNAGGGAPDTSPAGLYSGAARTRTFRSAAAGRPFGGGGNGGAAFDAIAGGAGSVGHILLEWGPDI